MELIVDFAAAKGSLAQTYSLLLLRNLAFLKESEAYFATNGKVVNFVTHQIKRLEL